MAFLRRGTVKRPYKKESTITLTRSDGSPVKFTINDIEAWEEYHVGKVLGKQVSVRYNSSFITVKESFETIDQEINGKAVQP